MMKLYEVETDGGTVQVEARDESHAGALGIRKTGSLRAMCVREVKAAPKRKKVKAKSAKLPLGKKAAK